MIHDKSRAIKLIQKKGWKVLAKCGKGLKDDHEVVLEAIGINGDAIALASERIQKDYNMTIFAVQNGSQFAYETAVIAFANDIFIACVAVRRHGHLYDKLSPELQKQSDVLLASLHSCPSIVARVADHDLLRSCIGKITDGATMDAVAACATQRGLMHLFPQKQQHLCFLREDVD